MSGPALPNSSMESLLALLAVRGEMDAQTFLAAVSRPRTDYSDFFQVAALLHAGYIGTDSITEIRGEKIPGRLGATTRDTSIFLCQLMLKPGESFEIDGCPR